MERNVGSAVRLAVVLAACALPAAGAAGDAAGARGAGPAVEAVDVTVYVIGERGSRGGATGCAPSRIRGERPPAAREISLDLRQRPVADAVREIGRQLGLGVVFDEGVGPAAQRTISAHVDRGRGVGVLDILLEDNGLEAQVVGRVLSVSPAP